MLQKPVSHFQFLTATLFCICLLFFAFPSLAAQQRQFKSILVISPFSAERSDFENALNSALVAGSPFSIDIDHEYMNSMDFGEFDEEEDWLRAVGHKYQRKKPDVVIAYFFTGAKLIAALGNDVFPNTPIVVCPIDDRWLTKLTLSQNIAVCTDHDDIRGSVEAALRLRPETRELVVVNGSSDFEKLWEEEIRVELGRLGSRIDVTYLSGLPMASIRERLSRLPPNALVYLSSLIEDGAGQGFQATESLSQLHQASAVPIFGGYFPSYLGGGIVGGSLEKWEVDGKRSAALALQILRGKKPSEIAPLQDNTSAYSFDARELARWKLSEKLLPTGSEVYFRPPSFWTLYQWHVLGVLVSIIEAGLIFALLLQGRRRHFAQLALESDRAFKALVTDLARALVALPVAGIGEALHPQMNNLIRALDLDQVVLAKPAPDLGKWDLLIVWELEETRDLVQKYRFADFPWFAQSTLSEGMTLIHQISDLPIEAAQEKQFLLKRGIRSFARIPLKKNSIVLGTMVFLDSRKEHNWSPASVQQLEMLAAVFSSFLQRRASEEALRESEIAKADILDSLASNIAVISPDGRIAATNAAWMENGKLYEADPAKIGIGVDYLSVCERAFAEGEADAGKALLGIQAVLHGPDDYFDMEYRLGPKEEQKWFHMKVRPLKTRERGAVILHLDVTALKSAELAVRESELRFRTVADTAPVMVWMSGPDKLYTYFNKSWLNFTGRTVGQERGVGWANGVHPQDLRACLDTYTKAFDARQPFETEYRLRRHDGEFRWVLDAGVPRYGDDNTFLGYIGSCIDITERKNMEQKLLDLSGRLIAAQEEERARIARDLHDDVSQRMALILIGLDRLQDAHPERWEDVVRDLQEIAKTADEASNDIRDLSHELHPSKLEKLGLDTAARGLCRDFSKLHKVEVEYFSRDLPSDIPFETALCLYRVIQESLMNVAKHSSAQEARVELIGRGHKIMLRVSDPGIGFVPGAEPKSRGLGLLSMKERIRLIGGSFTILSKRGAGTRIICSAPSNPILDTLK